LPREWIRRIKRSIMSLVPVFNTNRMVEQYTERCYIPSNRREAKLSANRLQAARELADWRRRVRSNWEQVKVESVEAPTNELMRVGTSFPVRVRVNLGPFKPEDVEVQLCHGVLDAMGEIAEPKAMAMAADGEVGGRSVLFTGEVPCRSSGQFGFSVRVLPRHANLPHLFEPGLVKWG
jgi:starch phosphorylase